MDYTPPNRKLKIAAFHSFLTGWGGAANAFYNMVVALTERGHEVHVYALNVSPEFMKDLSNKRIKVSSIEFNEWNIRKIPVFGALHKVLNELKVIIAYHRFLTKSNFLKQNYDIVFTHHFNYTPLIHTLLERKIPIAYYCPEPPRYLYESFETRKTFKIRKLFKTISNSIDRTIDKYCVRKSDIILTNSYYTREYVWIAYGRYSTTVYLGVDSRLFHRMSDIVKENQVLSVGRLHNMLKGHDFIVKALSFIPESERPKFVVVGDGNEKEKKDLTELALKNKVTLEFKSNLSQQDMILEYNRSRLTLMAYVMEPFGLVALESMTCGTPVVAVREGGLRESILDEVTGLLVDRDERKFAEKVRELLTNNEKKSQLSENGINHVKKNFSWDICAKNLETAMYGLIG